MTKPAVSVVIVNYNGGDMLPRCLDFVYGQRSRRDFDITVVDNGSLDHSIRLVRAHYPQTRVILLGSNQGFSAAFNRGVSETSGEYVLSLNFDVELYPDFIERGLEAVASGPRIGMVSGKLWRNPPGRGAGQIDSTGIELRELFMADRGQGETDRGQYDEQGYVFGPSGAAALYSREMLEDVRIGAEYVDEDFFAFVEDVDLAWRARLRGWRAVYAPAAMAVHYRGATRHDNANRQREFHYLGVRNRYWMLYKNLTADQWQANRGPILAAELRGVARFVKHYGLGVTVAALWAALRGLRRMRAKRRGIQSRRTAQRSTLDTFLFPQRTARQVGAS